MTDSKRMTEGDRLDIKLFLQDEIEEAKEELASAKQGTEPEHRNGPIPEELQQQIEACEARLRALISESKRSGLKALQAAQKRMHRMIQNGSFSLQAAHYQHERENDARRRAVCDQIGYTGPGYYEAPIERPSACL